MKRSIMLVCFCMLLASMIAGCRKELPDEGEAAAERLRRETSEAVDAARDYAEVKRKQFMATMESNLEELQLKWNRLKQRAEEEGEEVSDEFQKQKKTFDAKLAEARARLDDAEDLTGEAWEGARDAAWAAYAELKETYERMAARYEQGVSE